MSDANNVNAGTYSDDPLMNADKRPQLPRLYFGIVINASRQDLFVRSGIRRAFDPRHDKPNEKSVEAQIDMLCYKADGSTYNMGQKSLHWDQKWAVTLTSLQALGLQFGQLKDARCAFKMVPTGRKYMASKYDASGNATEEKVEREERAISIIAVYDSDKALKTAQSDHTAEVNGETPTNDSDEQAGPVIRTNIPKVDYSGNAAASGSDPEDAQAEEEADALALSSALKALWTASGGNKKTFEAMLKSNPALSNGITTAKAIQIAQS